MFNLVLQVIPQLPNKLNICANNGQLKWTWKQSTVLFPPLTEAAATTLTGNSTSAHVLLGPRVLPSKHTCICCLCEIHSAFDSTHQKLDPIRIPLYNVALFQGGFSLLEQLFYLEAMGTVMTERKGGALGRLPQHLSTCPPDCSSLAREMYVVRMLKVYPSEHVCVEDAGGFHFCLYQ